MIKVIKSLKSSQDKMANMVHEMYNIMNHQPMCMIVCLVLDVPKLTPNDNDGSMGVVSDNRLIDLGCWLGYI
jgi:hypothetical protein